MAGADLMGDRDGHGYFRVPREVRGLAGTHVVSVHCGSNFTLAVDRNGLTHRCVIDPVPLAETVGAPSHSLSRTVTLLTQH